MLAGFVAQDPQRLWLAGFVALHQWASLDMSEAVGVVSTTTEGVCPDNHWGENSFAIRTLEVTHCEVSGSVWPTVGS